MASTSSSMALPAPGLNAMDLLKNNPAAAACPSSGNLRLIRYFEKRGSGSSGLEFKRPAVGAASDGLRWLSLSETKSGRIGDASRPGWGATEYGRRSEWRAMSANLYSMTGAFGFDCSSLRKIEVNIEDAARQIRRHGQGSRVGSSQLASHNSHSAMESAAMLVDHECPLSEVAG